MVPDTILGMWSASPNIAKIPASWNWHSEDERWGFYSKRSMWIRQFVWQKVITYFEENKEIEQATRDEEDVGGGGAVCRLNEVGLVSVIEREGSAQRDL